MAKKKFLHYSIAIVHSEGLKKVFSEKDLKPEKYFGGNKVPNIERKSYEIQMIIKLWLTKVPSFFLKPFFDNEGFTPIFLKVLCLI